MRFSTALVAALPLVAASPLTKRAPLHIRDDADLIPGKYIVKMKGGSHLSSAGGLKGAIEKLMSAPEQLFEGFGAFAGSLDDTEVESLRDNPDVEYIEQDARAKIFATQQNATWGPARISHKEPGADTYEYDDAAGEGTCIYIVDTGIDVDHPDLEGRATFVATYVDGIKEDDNGHGTHCAGTAGSKTYGVAKKAQLYAIKIFDKNGDGSNSLMISGMERAVQDAPNRDCPKGVAVSMSFGNAFSQAVNDAAAAINDKGYFPVVAAGNGNILQIPQDVSGYSPASEPSVCTIGATDKDDKTAYFTNYGKGLDLYGPGVDIVSLAPGGGTASMDGTSMATPHIAGLGAYFMSLGRKADGLCDYLKSIALKDVVSGVPSGTANLLAQNDKASSS